jgi:xanthine dehydrogenase accessory factor
MKRAILDAVIAARAEKRALALATNLESGAQLAITDAGNLGDLEASPAINTAAVNALRHDKPLTIAGDDGPVFVQPFNPPLRMFIVGGVHIAQALAPMGVLAGYDVTVNDPRGSFASQERFPGVTLSDQWPDEALAAYVPDGRTAIVTLTHDPKLDDPALAVGLRSPAFYIGALGSRKTHAARLERLAALGFSDEDLSRIHGPLGLSLGGRSPAEIAIAALAQATQALHQDGRQK